MKRSNLIKNIAIMFILLLTMLFILQTISNATTIDTDEWRPGELDPDQMETLTDTAGVIVSAIRIIGIIVTVVVLMILGIKYMTGSASEKAEYKKTMIPYLVGVVLFFSLSQILGIIIDIVSSANS